MAKPTILFVVTDEWLSSEDSDNSSRLVGIFDSEQKAAEAVAAVDAHWEAFDGGSQEDEHFCGYFDYEGPLNAFTLPEYDETVGGEDDDEEEDELDDLDEDDE